MKVLGYEHVSFDFKDGHKVDGNYIYLHDDAAKNVTGQRTERVFLSDGKAQACGFSPKVGASVRVFYNKFGKVDEIRTVSP